MLEQQGLMFSLAADRDLHDLSFPIKPLHIFTGFEDLLQTHCRNSMLEGDGISACCQSCLLPATKTPQALHTCAQGSSNACRQHQQSPLSSRRAQQTAATQPSPCRDFKVWWLRSERHAGRQCPGCGVHSPGFPAQVSSGCGRLAGLAEQVWKDGTF